MLYSEPKIISCSTDTLTNMLAIENREFRLLGTLETYEAWSDLECCVEVLRSCCDDVNYASGVFEGRGVRVHCDAAISDTKTTLWGDDFLSTLPTEPDDDLVNPNDSGGVNEECSAGNRRRSDESKEIGRRIVDVEFDETSLAGNLPDYVNRGGEMEQVNVGEVKGQGIEGEDASVARDNEEDVCKNEVMTSNALNSAIPDFTRGDVCEDKARNVNRGATMGSTNEECDRRSALDKQPSVSYRNIMRERIVLLNKFEVYRKESRIQI